jgi:hypothetical protein
MREFYTSSKSLFPATSKYFFFYSVPQNPHPFKGWQSKDMGKHFYFQVNPLIIKLLSTLTKQYLLGTITGTIMHKQQIRKQVIKTTVY